eukprot:4432709-Lingulodinium_polyedra.AAC.1
MLAYADGGCRASGYRDVGVGASACVLLAFSAGFRRARLVQVSGCVWERATAPLAEVLAAAMATRALVAVSRGRLERQPGFVPWLPMSTSRSV